MTPSNLDDTLSALADPTRRGIVDLLRQQPVSAGDIAKKFSMSLPAMSRHLRVLRNGGLIEDRRDESDARVRLYQLKRERFDDLGTWLGEIEEFWGDQLASFKSYAESRGKRQ